MRSRDKEPIACTLTVGAYDRRLAAIARLNKEGLCSYRRKTTSLELHYAGQVRDRVHALVRQEAECCAFLAFTVDESADEVRVTITVPERTRDVADQLFEPFLPPDTAKSASTVGR